MLHQNISLASPTDTGLNVDSLSVSVGKTSIVSDVSFEASPGEVLTIIGPSGSGKTTLLKAMTGEIGYNGRALLSGQEIRGISPEFQADMRAVLPQISQISFPLTVSEVVGLGVIDRTTGREQCNLRISKALSKVGLQGFEGRTYQDLSGGEQQRAQLARVLCQVWEPVPADGRPRWLFLDEPVSSLDIKHQYQIMQLAADYAERGGGVVAVMHDLNLTAVFADKVLVMKDGHRLAFGARETVLNPDLLSRAYDFPLQVRKNFSGKAPVVLPAAEVPPRKT